MELPTRRFLVAFLVLFWLPAPAASQAAARTAAAVPKTIPIFPLPDVSLLPNATEPFHIFEPRYRDMIADALAADSIIGMVTLQPGFEADYEGRPPVYELGCAGVILASERLDDGRYNIVLGGITKFRILSEDQSRSYRLAEIEAIPETLDESQAEQLAERRRQLENAILSAMPGARLPPADAPDAEVIDGLAIALPLELDERLRLLEADGPLERAERMIGRLRGGPRSSI